MLSITKYVVRKAEYRIGRAFTAGSSWYKIGINWPNHVMFTGQLLTVTTPQNIQRLILAFQAL